MSAFLQELSKPQWWLSVVVAGIAINLVSAYLKSPIDRLLAAGPAWLRARNEKKRALWELLVKRLRESSEERHYAMHVVIRQRTSAVMFLVFTVLFLVLPSAFATLGHPAGQAGNVLTLAGSAFSFFASFRSFLWSTQFADALNAVRSGEG